MSNELAIIESGALQDGSEEWDELPFVVLCAHWHGGQASAMCSYLSSGHINSDALLGEIDQAESNLWADDPETLAIYAAALGSFRRFIAETGDREAPDVWDPRW